MEGKGHTSREDGPYAPAGLICTVSFISPERNAAIAFACPTVSGSMTHTETDAAYHTLRG